MKHSDLPKLPEAFARFLGRGGLTGAPTDGSKEAPKRRPFGNAIRALGLVGVAALALTIPGTTNNGAAAAHTAGPNAAAVQEEKSRLQQHLDRGVEMTWFHSSVRPMSTVMYFDRNRLTMSVERHGGIDTPPEAEGVLPFSAFMQIKSMQIRMEINNTVRTATGMLEQLPDWDGPDANPHYDTLRELVGKFKGQIPSEPRPIKDVVKDAEFLLNQAMILAEFNDVDFDGPATQVQMTKIKETQIDALIMDMAINARARLEQQDAQESLEFLRQLRPPEQPKKDPNEGMLVNNDGEVMMPSMRLQRVDMRPI
ncbi:MAG: hypothetical protein KI792_10905 [Alphaproteobacteria bacterium]|nr:hypothetical protein [Alphaproteobacteria bacterium SS10]